MDTTIQICRLCLDTKQPSQTSINDGSFRTRWTAVSNFNLDDSDQLPSSVCSECSMTINQFYTFVETVRSNQEQLQQSLSPIQVKNEIFLESTYEHFECMVKTEEQSPEHKIETMDVEVEMFEDPPIAEKIKDEEEPSSSPLPINDEERVEISAEDRLIKQFFSLKCDTCEESFETFKQLKVHSKKVHSSQTVLQCCNKSFTFKHKMLYHINTHLKPFKCDACGKGYPDIQTMQAHYSIKHVSQDEKPFQCDKCTRSFHTERLLRTHLLRHVQKECPICKKTLSDAYNLKTHIAGMHNHETNFICDVCGKGFKSPGALDSHRQSHKESKREDGARCEICDKWISRKKYLRNHIMEVHQGKEVACDICHKVYPNEKSLTTHKGRVHVADKFECEICGKRFKRPINLKEHRASHTGQKLYSCEFCGMKMNSSGNLYQHKKNKHPVEWMQAKQRAVN